MKNNIVLKMFSFVQLVSQNLDVLQSHDTPWSLSNIPLLEGYLSVMDGNPLQEVIKAVIEQYKLHVDPKISSFSKGNTVHILYSFNLLLWFSACFV